LHEVVARAARLEPSSERPPHVAPDVAESMASADLAAAEEPREARELREEEPARPREPEPASDLVAALLAELVERHAEESSRSSSELPPVLAAEPEEQQPEPTAVEAAPAEAVPESTPFVPYASDEPEQQPEEEISAAP